MWLQKVQDLVRSRETLDKWLGEKEEEVEGRRKYVQHLIGGVSSIDQVICTTEVF